MAVANRVLELVYYSRLAVRSLIKMLELLSVPPLAKPSEAFSADSSLLLTTVMHAVRCVYNVPFHLDTDGGMTSLSTHRRMLT